MQISFHYKNCSLNILDCPSINSKVIHQNIYLYTTVSMLIQSHLPSFNSPRRIRRRLPTPSACHLWIPPGLTCFRLGLLNFLRLLSGIAGWNVGEVLFVYFLMHCAKLWHPVCFWHLANPARWRHAEMSDAALVPNKPTKARLVTDLQNRRKSNGPKILQRAEQLLNC